jgi:hypothetical protein
MSIAAMAGFMQVEEIVNRRARSFSLLAPLIFKYFRRESS